MTSKKPNWKKTNVSWENSKQIWLQWSLGNTVTATLKHFQLNIDKYPDIPLDRATITEVREELLSLPYEIITSLLSEMPNLRGLIREQRSDLVKIIELKEGEDKHKGKILTKENELGRTTNVEKIDKRIFSHDKKMFLEADGIIGEKMYVLYT
jgi:hypothetical protein